jgi:transposase
VIVRKEWGGPKRRQHLNGTDGFWGYGKHWLDHNRSVPKKFLRIRCTAPPFVGSYL